MKNAKQIVKLLFVTTIILFFISAPAQELLVIESKNLPKNDSVYIFTPDDYNTSKTYPVVYLLHGYGGDYGTWNRVTAVQDYADKYDFIIVCPDGLYESWYVNSPVKSDSKYEDFFFKELYTTINKKYKTDKKNIFITGLSMGGYGSLYLFAKNTGKFKAAGSTSGLLDLLPFAQNFGLPKIFGNSSTHKQNFIDYSIISFIDALKKSKYHIITDCGTEDPFYSQNKDFFEKCSNAGVKISFSYRPGDHNRDYWKESIKDHFQYFYYLSNKN